MAVTKIHPVKTTADRSITYIINPNKTDELALVDCISCSTYTAKYDFEFALSNTNRDRKDGSTQAYHLIQSFAPGEVTPEFAHQIGMELADKILGGKYCCIIATHVDKEHIHNHILWCAADNIEHKKYNDCKSTYIRIRNVSDKLCREHDLSVIEPSGKQAQKYNEWQADREGTSWKSKIKADIDEAVKRCADMDEFLKYMRDDLGYEIKGGAADGRDGKYICFKPKGKERWVRGSVKNFGSGYTREELISRLARTAQRRESFRRVFGKEHRYAKMLKQGQSTTMIDTSARRFQESPGLKKWADKENLKTAAHIYAESGGVDTMEDKLQALSDEYGEVYQRLLDLEKSDEYRKYKAIRPYLSDYKEFRPFHIAYEKARDKETYFDRHQRELIRYDGAVNMLKREGVSLNLSEIEKGMAIATELQSEHEELNRRLKDIKFQMKELGVRKQSFGRFMGTVPVKEKRMEMSETHKMRNQKRPDQGL